MKPSEKMANELHSEHCNFERYGTKCTCGTQALVDEVSQLEDKIATLRAELMSLKGAYYSANNKGWQLEFDNAAFRRFCSMVRESIEGGRVVTFQDVDIEELDALLTEKPE